MKNKKEKILNIIIFVAFIVLSFIIATKHEYWADEAQSWMIARDNSFIEIMKMTRYEGTPCLWTMFLKVFISMGLPYQYFYIIPWLCSIIGIFVLLFKLKIPQILKVALPFSYFIFYQYTIFARSYCLILPVLALIALYYKEKENKIITYSILLTCLMGISSHTYLMSGSLFLDLLYSLYKKDKFKLGTKKYVVICILAIFYLITFIMVVPNKNCGSLLNSGRSLCVCISNALFSSKLNGSLIAEILCFVCFAIFVKQSDIKNRLLLILFLISPLIINTFVHAEIWHIGIFFLTFVFYCIFTEEINNKVFKYMILIFCIISINWTILSCKYDFNNVMSPNEEVIAYLKAIDAENKKVYGIGFNSVEFNPYFEENLYDNYNSEKGYYKWNLDNGYMSREEIENDLPDIFVCHWLDADIVPKDTGYTKKVFEGRVFLKDRMYIDNIMHVYVKEK